MIGIRPYEKRFEKDLVEICWRTGFMYQPDECATTGGGRVTVR